MPVAVPPTAKLRHWRRRVARQRHRRGRGRARDGQEAVS